MNDNTTPAGESANEEFYGSYMLLEKNGDWPTVGWASPGMEADAIEAWEEEGYEILPFVVLTTSQHAALTAELQRLRSEIATKEAEAAYWNNHYNELMLEQHELELTDSQRTINELNTQLSGTEAAFETFEGLMFGEGGDA